MRIKKYSFFLYFTCTIFADNTTTLHQYLWANYNHFSGKKDQATTWYKKLFSTKHSPYTYKGYLDHLYENHQFNTIVQCIPHLSKKFEKDLEVQLLFANSLEKTNHIEESDNYFITLSQTFKHDSEITFKAAHIYIKRKELENALLTLDSFLNNTPRRPHNFVFYFLKTQIYVQLNKFNDALKSIDLCLDHNPQCDKAWFLYAFLSEKEGNIKNALAGYTNFLEIAPHNPTIKKHLLTLTLKYNTITENNNVLLSNAISLENALLLFKQQRYEQALTHINSCIQQKPHDNECKLLKLQILSAMKDVNQIQQIITQWITNDPSSHIWAQGLYLLSHQSMTAQDTLKTFKSLIHKIPDNPWLNLYCADLCLRESEPHHAITYLNNALQCSLDNSLRAKTLYQLALLYYEQENYPSMITHLEKAYGLDNNSPFINNTLAYYWATKGNNLEKAQSFLNKALEYDKSNPSFLNTHARILYKEKKYTQALALLEPLQTHNNGTILLHMAKIHLSLNNKEIADTFTKKAQPIAYSHHEKKALNKMEQRLALK